MASILFRDLAALLDPQRIGRLLRDIETYGGNAPSPDKLKRRCMLKLSALVGERRKMLQAWADYLDMRCAWAILGR